MLLLLLVAIDGSGFSKIGSGLIPGCSGISFFLRRKLALSGAVVVEVLIAIVAVVEAVTEAEVAVDVLVVADVFEEEAVMLEEVAIGLELTIIIEEDPEPIDLVMGFEIRVSSKSSFEFVLSSKFTGLVSKVVFELL